jgi:outer membrane immunogenic protein
MKLTTRSAVLIALISISGAASAQGIVATSTSDRWAGFYVGVNGGVAVSTTCNTWEANGPLAGTALFNNRDCPNKTAGVGGVQIGYDFQSDQIVWGFGLDYDFYSAKTKTKSLVYSGTTFPDGTYTFTGKNSPSGFGILGPRIGYALDNWLPYIRAGGVFTSGKSNLTATAPNGAIFDGGKNYKSHGFGVGAGVDYALPESWSIRAEYTYVNLGKGSNSLTGCTGSTAACDAYQGLSLDNIHNSFTFSIIRIGVNYEF